MVLLFHFQSPSFHPKFAGFGCVGQACSLDRAAIEVNLVILHFRFPFLSPNLKFAGFGCVGRAVRTFFPEWAKVMGKLLRHCNRQVHPIFIMPADQAGKLKR